MNRINKLLLSRWRQTSCALAALTDPELSIDEAMARFRAAAIRFPVECQAWLITAGARLKRNNIRVRAA